MTPRKWICYLLPALSTGLLPACFTPASYAPSAVRPFLAQSMTAPNMAQYYAPVPQYANMPQYNAMLPYRPTPQWTFANYQPQAQYIAPDPHAGPFSQALAHSSPVESKVDAAGIPLDPDGSYDVGAGRMLVPGESAPVVLASGQDNSEITTATAPSAPDQVKPRMLPSSITDESKLITALRFEIDNREQDARDALKEFEPRAQEFFRALMPLAVTVSQGGLAKADPQQVAVVIEQLEKLIRSLQPHAPLTIGKFCFCHSIRKYSSFDPMDNHPTYQPGEMADVYAEFRNVCCESHHTERGDFRTDLVCTWDLRKPSGESVWDGPRQLDKLDETMSPQHDHFQHFRFQMPHLSPGPYVLELEVVDLPTGRKARQKLEFTVGPPVQVAREE